MCIRDRWGGTIPQRPHTPCPVVLTQYQYKKITGGIFRVGNIQPTPLLPPGDPEFREVFLERVVPIHNQKYQMQYLQS